VEWVPTLELATAIYLYTVGAAVRQLKKKMEELQVVLSLAVYNGYLSLTEEAVEICNFFFKLEVGAGMDGIQYISGYKGVLS
jgi:hypothetical protein